ncbi:MAG: c-type cytochrome [Ignavibacteriaceae bacterium]|nr:cytochrome c [Ignavibacteria bacterium]MBT8391992.1 cytochrome c [Ignavibacteria bacterium]NNJ53148.1 c-type cytochrome [Ignavibacteriaceae bacterium]NNL21053.1 c-type cytochrome [Ignavibacteriaceae bacterium]
MTKPQIWVSAFLVLFILLFIIGRITKEKETERIFSNQINNTTSQQNTTELTAEQLVKNFGCVNCHGTDLAGTNLGPSLKKLSEYWSKKSLIAYLRNPTNYMNEERFKEYKEKYPSQIMPGYGEKNIKDLGKIAEYLLRL